MMLKDKEPMSATAEPLLQPERAPLAGAVVALAGLAALVLGGTRIAEGAGVEPSGPLVFELLFEALLGALLLVVGVLMAARKGGLLRRPDGHLALLGIGERDALLIPPGDVTAVRLFARDETWGRNDVALHVCELETRGGVPIWIAESAELNAVFMLARRLEDALAVPMQRPEALPERTAEPDAPESGSVLVRTGRGGLLLTAYGLFAALSFVTGVLMMTNVQAAPISGFLFGPVLAVLGVAFSALCVVGRFGVSELRWTATHVGVQERLGFLTWGRKEVPREPSLYVRLRHRGVQGAALDVVTPAATLVPLAGIGAHSRFRYAELVALAERLQRTLPPPPAAP